MDGDPGMGMDGMDDEDMPIMAGASRPWLSTTGIPVLLSVFLISLVGIILFSLYLYFLQAKLECPNCKVADVATIKRKKLTTTTTSTESILRQVETPEEEEEALRLRMRRRRRRLLARHRRHRRLARIWRRLRPYYQARLYEWLWRLLSAEIREQRQRADLTALLEGSERLPDRRQRLLSQASRQWLRSGKMHCQGLRLRRPRRWLQNGAFAWGRRWWVISAMG